MKRVITALTVKQAHAAGKTQLYAPIKETIITPEARTLAKSLGIQFIEGPANATASTGIELDEKVVQQIVRKVLDSLPPSRRNHQKVKSVVVEVLSSYLKNQV